MYGGTAAGAFYPYFQLGQGATAYGHGQGYGAMQYPQVFQYSSIASSAALTGFTSQFNGPISFAPNPMPKQCVFAIKQA